MLSLIHIYGAVHAFNSVQAIYDGAAAAVEGCVHDFHVVLRAGQRGEGCALGDVVDVGGHVGLQVGGCGDDVARANHPCLLYTSRCV